MSERDDFIAHLRATPTPPELQGRDENGMTPHESLIAVYDKGLIAWNPHTKEMCLVSMQTKN